METAPDILLLDIQLEEVRGLDIIPRSNSGTHRTVENILHCIYDKTGISSRAGLQKM
jgi:DNA-binding NarL/FixJ family response regulator